MKEIISIEQDKCTEQMILNVVVQYTFLRMCAAVYNSNDKKHGKA